MILDYGKIVGLYNDDAFENYGKKVEQAYEKWQKTADKQLFNLNNETAPKTKIVKDLVQQFDEKAKSKYAELTLAQIKDLLINRKWHTQIYEGIYALYKTVSQHITERIVEVAERYEQTLPEINEEVARLEKKVQEHLVSMGFKSITN